MAQSEPSLPHLESPVIIVANRGPNDFVWQDGEWITRGASGGLVSMLTPLAQQADVAWFCCVSEPPAAEEAREGLFTTAADQTDPRLHVIPVPVPAGIYHAYYGTISNEVLWMLQHYVIGPGGYQYLDARRHRAWEQGYLEANRRLARAVTAASSAPRAFLIQDYHLYPLPALLRRDFPDTPILHFTHIPFPQPSVWRLLPDAWRKTVFQGLLGADVVGLQTPEDVRGFVSSCAEFLDVEVDRHAATVRAPDGRLVRAVAYPASVDPRSLGRDIASPSVEPARERLAPRMADRQTIIRVDRLDPSKNQLVGFLAFERLLEMRPELCSQIRFLAFLVPSRTDLSIYRAYRDALYDRIERINERFADACGGPPVEVFYTNDREQALVAMERCDVLLVNSLEDGMNLVAKEWAVVSNRPGVLIVSETAGVSFEADGSALLVSPLDVEGTAQAMADALDMPAEERERRLLGFRDRVQRWTARDWLLTQLDDLGVREDLVDGD